MSTTRFHLTHRAARDLRDIYAFSRDRWGEKTARAYIDKLYAAMGTLKPGDDRARQRAQRAFPFSMVPAERHFIVYEMMGTVPVILTLLHQQRNIEALIASFSDAFLAEIEDLRKNLRKPS